jgi:hypothetical protein
VGVRGEPEADMSAAAATSEARFVEMQRNEVSLSERPERF